MLNYSYALLGFSEQFVTSRRSEKASMSVGGRTTTVTGHETWPPGERKFRRTGLKFFKMKGNRKSWKILQRPFQP